MRAFLHCLILFVASLCTKASATQQCNMYNLAMQGGLNCVAEWWNARDLGQTITTTYKLSRKVENVMANLGVSLENDVNRHLRENMYINATSVDLFAKVVETALAVEPYLAYNIADLLLGVELSPAELARFGLSPEFVKRESLTRMYTEYMDFSCGKFGVRPVVTCLKDWMTSNCSPEDQPELLLDFLDNFANAYCDGERSDPTVIQRLTDDLGTVYKDTLAAVGLDRDDRNPYIFNFSNSLVSDQKSQTRLANYLNYNCSIYTSSIGAADYAKPTSTTGAGIVASSLLSFYDAYYSCVYRAVETAFPKIFQFPKYIEHQTLLASRYGIGKDGFTKKIDVATRERQSVMMFGLSHLKAYRIPQISTCLDFDWQTYLANEYFLLEGYVDPSYSGTPHYVTEIRINFLKDDRQNYFHSDGHSSQHNLGSDIVEKLQNYEIINHSKSGTLFGIGISRDSRLFITVRMGKKLLEASLGTMILGCRNTATLSTLPEDARATGCKRSCSDNVSVEELQELCSHDCYRTQDSSVADMTQELINAKRYLEDKDRAVWKALGGATTDPTTKSPEGSSTAGGGNLLSSTLSLLAPLVVLHPQIY